MQFAKVGMTAAQVTASRRPRQCSAVVNLAFKVRVFIRAIECARATDASLFGAVQGQFLCKQEKKMAVVKVYQILEAVFRL